MRDGFLLVNKPMGFTSFDVIAKLRGMLGQKKIGHGGTLDPNVTGVLPIFLGRGTKAIDMLSNHDKKYVATFRLGVQTDTQDIWGEVIDTKESEKDIKKIEEAVLSFKGKQNQLPPMYSAIKVNGVRLYDLAREGKVISRQEREIEVYDIEFLGKTENEDEYKISVYCSKGTYIRTLCADIGEKLGCGAAMTSLVRVMAHGFEIADCHSLDEIQKMVDEKRVEEIIRPVKDLFSDLVPIYLEEKQEKMYKNGVPLDPKRVSGVIYDEAYVIAEWQKYAVYNKNGQFLGIGQVKYPEREFRSLKLFLSEE